MKTRPLLLAVKRDGVSLSRTGIGFGGFRLSKLEGMGEPSGGPSRALRPDIANSPLKGKQSNRVRTCLAL